LIIVSWSSGDNLVSLGGWMSSRESPSLGLPAVQTSGQVDSPGRLSWRLMTWDVYQCVANWAWGGRAENNKSFPANASLAWGWVGGGGKKPKLPQMNRKWFESIERQD
jgi:hypothetical protein